MDLNDLAKNPEQIKNLIDILQALLPQEKPKPAETKIKTKSRQRKRAVDNADSDINKFENMPEFRMHKDDIKIDKKLNQNPPTARVREFNLLDVVCRVCGKKESISPSLLFESPSRYKCNNCSTSAG
jgi:hypothetical protein